MKTEMKSTLQDTLQVGAANIGAIGISMAQINQILTAVSLIMAISFSVYKFYKSSKNN